MEILIMQVHKDRTLHKITRYDGFKTALFVIFCLAFSVLMLSGAVALLSTR
jgi:hypothetical protein